MTAPYAYRRTTNRPKAPRKSPEHDLQVAVKTFLTHTLPADVEWTSSLAGAYLGPTQRAKMKASGLRGGWPDLQFCINRRMFFIELKAPVTVKSRTPERYGTLDDPDLDDEQVRVLSRLHPACWAVCRSVEEVEAALVRFGVALRPYVWA